VQGQGTEKDSSELYLFAPVKNKKGKTTGYELVVGPKTTRQELLASRYVKKWKRENCPSDKKKNEKQGACAAANSGSGGEVPTDHKLLFVPGTMALVRCTGAERYCPGVPTAPSTTYYYLFKYDPTNEDTPIPEMTGNDLNLKGTRQDISSQGATQGQPIVTMSFTGKGAKKFQKVTQGLAERGRVRWTQGGGQNGQQDNYAQQFAIVLDREIRSAPTVSFLDNPNGIAGNNGAEITGIGSIKEAKDLALVLQTGALPYDFRQLEKTEISATLGKDSLQQAKKAAIFGLIIVALFLLVFYRFLGLVAVIGLGIYAAFLYAAMLLFHVTLTLPGFAGLVLTIGVAADANVVIFERIKEEVRAGKSVRAAISSGYEKGFHTIIDANVVTCITALVLFLVATAGVKGFALMLLIGTLISLITAVVATRAMLGLLAGFRWFENPKFMGATATEIPRWQRIDVVGRRRLWLTLSVVAVVLSIFAIAFKGLNLGIDFKGGTQVTFNTPSPQAVDSVRSEAKSIDPALSKAIIQGKGPNTNGEFKSFQLRTKSLSPALGAKLRNGLQSKLQATNYGAKNVSASFSRQVLRGALLAIIVSFALIALYVTIRYRWRFAVPILRTLLNDIPIVMGVYAISGREVTVSTVAAILTILGYSVYDTIIVFDRVRENMRLMPRASIATIANLSVWEVLRRSIVTSVITLLPIISLFIFGGDTLKDFAFAIMVGISVGAVSTIFIATPLLTQLMERDPEYARRKDQDGEADLEAIIEGAKVPAAATATKPVPETVPMGEPAVPVAEAGNGEISRTQSKRERRRQRRRARPHGRR
jgi:SecD/SecF fusion protein